MRIYSPVLTFTNEHATLSATIEYKSSKFPLPNKLFFCYPIQYKKFLLLRGDAFLVGAVISAMALREDIQIDAPISPKLLAGLIEYQKILTIWFSKKLYMVEIKCNTLEALDYQECKGSVASLYSGGVDSTYILRANLHPQQTIQDMQIKHAISILGVDLPLGQFQHFNYLNSISQPSIEKLGVNLITCSTNVRSFTEGLVKWDYAHGAAILSAGIVLSGLLKRLYIASSYNYLNLASWGSSPLLDHLLSTETLDIVHCGASQRRADKIKAIANWNPAQTYLRVCNSIDSSVDVNCEKCEKCLSTKAIMEVEGVLDKFQSFRLPFNKRDYFRWAWNCAPKTVIPRYVYREALVKRRYVLVPLALVVYFARLVKYWLDRFMPTWMRKLLREYYFPLEKNPFYMIEKIP